MYKNLVILILLLALFLRFYNLPEVFVFAGDEEYQALLAQSIIKDFHIIWIGVNAAHTGFYLGPFWTYFTAFWLLISGGNPLITGYISSIIGVLTAGLLIYTGTTLFNKKAGLISGLLYATSPLMVYLDQKYWNPTPIPFLSLMMFLSLVKFKKNPKWLIVFAICAGFVFHTHLSLIPLILIGLFYIFKAPKKILLLSLLSFFIIISPLLIFDYFHKGSNVTTPLRFIQIQDAPVNKINPTQHFQAFFETMGRLFYLKPGTSSADEVITTCTTSSRTDSKPIVNQLSTRFTPPFWLSLFGIFILGLSLFQKIKLLPISIGAIVLTFLIFPGASFEYYLLGIFPLIFLIPGIFVKYFKILTIILAVLGIYTVINNNSQFGFSSKNELIKKVAQKLDGPFELKQTGVCHFYEGWRYLFVLNGKTPERSDSDQGLGWHYSAEITQNKTKFTVIMAEDRAPLSFDPKNAQILKQAGFTAYIFQN